MDVLPILKYRTRSALLLIGLFMSLYILWLLRGQDLYWERYWVGSLTIVFTSGWCAYLAWQAYQKAEIPFPKRSWFLITVGLGLWLLRNCLNLFLFTNWEPEILSVFAQMLYLAGGLLIWIGMGTYPRIQRVILSKVGFFLDVALTFSAVSLMLWDAWILPLFETRSISLSSGLIYTLVDSVTVTFFVVLFLITRADKASSALLWSTFAILSFAVSNINYIALISSNQKYSPGTTRDLGWVIGDIFIIIAILIQTNPSPSPRADLINRLLVRSQNLLPILSILLLGWFSILNWQFNNRFDTYSLWATLILSLVLLVSQGIQTGQNAMIRYAHLVNSIAEPAFVCDDLGKLRLINHAFLEISGYPHDILSKFRIDQLFVFQEQDQPWIENLLKGSSRQPAVDTAREVDLKTKSGELIPVMLNFRTIAAGNQQHLVYAATAHDLRFSKKQQQELLQAYVQVASARTELEQLNQDLEKLVDVKTSDLQRAYQTLEEQNKTLQQLDQIKSDFVSLVSHELRAPLTNIRGGIELLLHSPDYQNEKTNKTLQRVQSEILRLSKFTETILDLSAMDANRLPLYPEPLDIKAFTSSFQQFFSQIRGGEKIKWQIDPALPVVLADEKALHSILFHLLDNAIKYAPEGDILVIAKPEGQMVSIQVRDFGPGIAEEVLPHLFDRFYRGNMTDSQTVYGHGLGLYMVKRFVEALNGRITAENCAEGGSIFSVYLPYLQ